MPKGLSVSIYKNSNNCDTTLNGISSQYNTLILVGEDVYELFDTNPKEDYLILVKKGTNIYAEPASYYTKTKKDGVCMFGGNFIYSSDSRFSSLNNGNPIRIHDRIETYKEYEMYSN